MVASRRRCRGGERGVIDRQQPTVPRARPATLEEVARVAGVSRATVSRVVNGSPRVSSDARRAVEAAVTRLGYAPNRAARSLVTRRTDSVGLVVAESDERVFGEPFFASLVRGVSEALSGSEIQLVLLLARSSAERARIERYLATHLDGVVLVSSHANDPLLLALGGLGVPTVMAGRPQAAEAVPYVDADNLGGARAAVDHLVGRGRRCVATITGPLDMAAGLDRRTGYRQALEAAGRPLDPGLEAAGDFSTNSAERATSALLDREPHLDAIFAASDLMAVGAVRTLLRAGRRVPEDVAVVGFDDSVVAESATPPLTSVHQPVVEIGRRLVRVLLDAIGEKRSVPEATILPTRLVVRDSS
jgi:DNA-binding LacI/PurR family transcriptional regulator